MKKYTLEFPELDRVVINGESFLFEVDSERELDSFTAVWNLKAYNKSLDSFDHDFPELVFKFHVLSTDTGNGGRDVMADLSEDEDMRSLARIIIQDKMDTLVEFLREEQKELAL